MPFDGLEPIVELLRELTPRRRPAEELPITTVVTDAGADPELLKQVADWLSVSGVPYAHVSLESDAHPLPGPDEELREVDAADVDKVLDVLGRIAARLESDSGGRYRLPRFRDVEWLMSLSLARSGRPAPMQERRDALRVHLRNRAIRGVDNPQNVPTEVPWYLALPLILGPNGWLKLRHSGRIPLVSGRYRWFRRQPFLSPGMNGDFLALADRLTLDQRGAEVQEQVLLLLVNAFLEDLRSGHRGGVVRRYRTTNAIVLLSGVTRANGGYPLLQAVNSVRNDTGLLDPLLLVTSSQRVPPYADEPQDQPLDETATDSRLGPWLTELPRRWKERRPTAWYLPVTVRTPTTAGTRPGPRTGRGPREPLPRALAVPAVPRVRQRRTLAVLTALLMAAVLVPYWSYGRAHSERTCGDGFTWLGLESRDATAKRVDGTCVGITDGTNGLLVPDSPLFADTVARVLESNAAVDRIVEQSPGQRPVITLVFLAALVPAIAEDPNPLPAEAEQFAGLALAQKQQLDKGQASDPLVKVLIANAGRGAVEGEWVADQLGAMARQDPTIVAAVGLNESRAATDRMIKRLATVGIPVVAATLSADSLADENHMYYQVSPQNRRQAAVSAAYAANLLDTGTSARRYLRIYHSADETDIYSQNLAADLNAAFTERGFSVETATFTPSSPRDLVVPATPKAPAVEHFSESKGAGSDACNYPDAMVFYVGRPQPDFDGFLGSVNDNCPTAPPLIIAGDDVTRYVADDNARRRYSAVPFRYVSFAVADDPRRETAGFYRQLGELFPGRNISGLDGHAALTYDAARTVINAVGILASPGARTMINGGTLWATLPTLTDAGGLNQRYVGVTGEIDFGGRTDQRVPLDKPIAILQVRNGEPDAGEGAYCGSPADPRTQTWCPSDP
jgi:hypothetical protein